METVSPCREQLHCPIKKLQLSASYGLGFTKAYKLLDSDAHAANIEGKNRYWTVTAAWLF